VSRLNVLLLLIVVICALSVVNATNRQRELFISLGRAQMQERALQQDLAQLQYEQSSLSKTSRVEDTATSELKMETVTAGRTQYLTVAGASSAAAGDAPGGTTSASGQMSSGAIGSDASSADQTSAPQVGDDTSNTATSSDLRAVISASTPARAAKPAASGAQAASAPKAASASSKTATGAKASHAGAKTNTSATRHTKTAHTHGASQ
jgi:cell division protein FtsL